jgi:hypothetical protein
LAAITPWNSNLARKTLRLLPSLARNSLRVLLHALPPTPATTRTALPFRVHRIVISLESVANLFALAPSRHFRFQLAEIKAIAMVENRAVLATQMTTDHQRQPLADASSEFAFFAHLPLLKPEFASPNLNCTPKKGCKKQ